MFSQFLCSIVLAGIFSAISELLLPSRLSSLGRLLRAVIAVLIVILCASPILSFVLGGDPEDLLPAIPSLDGTEEDEQSLSPEETITALAERRLGEALEEELSALWNVPCRVSVSYDPDINRLSAGIYCDSPPQDAQTALRALGERYGMELCLENGGGEGLG